MGFFCVFGIAVIGFVFFFFLILCGFFDEGWKLEELEKIFV